VPAIRAMAATVPQVLGIVFHDERRNVLGVHGDGDAARRVRCVDTLEYAVPTRRSCEKDIETLSEPGRPLKTRDFCRNVSY
jgi:hypothetical protein